MHKMMRRAISARPWFKEALNDYETVVRANPDNATLTAEVNACMQKAAEVMLSGMDGIGGADADMARKEFAKMAGAGGGGGRTAAASGGRRAVVIEVGIRYTFYTLNTINTSSNTWSNPVLRHMPII